MIRDPRKKVDWTEDLGRNPPPKVKPKPKVMSVVPTYGSMNTQAAQSHYCMMTQGGCDVIPCFSTSSALCYSFNKLWAAALNYQKAGAVDYFLMHHSDIEVQTHHFMDVMVMEMERVNAAVLSVIQPIKDGKQCETSTAVETERGPWLPRKLTFDEIADLPETFTMPGLLVNTGLMLVDIRRPEFHAMVGNELFFHFEMNDRVIRLKDGQLIAQFRPEDWNFSRMCHSKGLPVWATRKVQCLHYGTQGYSNQPEAKAKVQVNNASENGSAVGTGCLAHVHDNGNRLDWAEG